MHVRVDSGTETAPLNFTDRLVKDREEVASITNAERRIVGIELLAAAKRSDTLRY
jgi:hypothetical protein